MLKILNAAWDGSLDGRKDTILVLEKYQEARSVDINVTNEWLLNIWPKLLEGYDDHNIFNADETGLFYKLTPDRILKFKNEKCVGGKLSKDRVTVLVCANGDGSEKRKLLVIGKAKQPRCFKNIKILPVTYENNKNVWMTADIFVKELRKWDSELGKCNRKILLTVDNCAAHPEINDLNNIKLVFLPPNTTAVLQPLDQGIINCLKANFRKMLVLKLIENMETGIKDLNVNLLDAIHFIDRSWNKVTSTTIKNCFVHAGFIRRNDRSQVMHDQVAHNLMHDTVMTDAEDFDFEDNLPLAEYIKIFGSKSVTMNDYIKVDCDVITNELQNDDNIIASCESVAKSSKMMEEGDDCDSENDQEANCDNATKIITLQEARHKLDQVRHFLESLNDADRAIESLNLL